MYNCDETFIYLREIARDPDFLPNKTDKIPEEWARKGLQVFSQMITNNIIDSYETLVNKFSNNHHFKYLQIRSYLMKHQPVNKPRATYPNRQSRDMGLQRCGVSLDSARIRGGVRGKRPHSGAFLFFSFFEKIMPQLQKASDYFIHFINKADNYRYRHTRIRLAAAVNIQQIFGGL